MHVEKQEVALGGELDELPHEVAVLEHDRAGGVDRAKGGEERCPPRVDQPSGDDARAAVDPAEAVDQHPPVSGRGVDEPARGGEVAGEQRVPLLVLRGDPVVERDPPRGVLPRRHPAPVRGAVERGGATGATRPSPRLCSLQACTELQKELRNNSRARMGRREGGREVSRAGGREAGRRAPG
eukprot:gene8583-biopygen9755